MHNFQDQLRQVLKQFMPLQALDNELDQLSVMFRESLGHLATALEPAATLQDRLTQLAAAFQPAKTLRQEFSVLARSFGRNSEGLPQ